MPAPDALTIARMKRDHTEITPLIMDGFPDAQHVWLKVGGQRFCVTPHGCDDFQAAEWTQQQLAVALTSLLQQDAKP